MTEEELQKAISKIENRIASSFEHQMSFLKLGNYPAERYYNGEQRGLKQALAFIKEQLDNVHKC